VVEIAASCGLLPKGAATKRDQLARENPSNRCAATTRKTDVFLKMKKCQSMATMIHAGKYARLMLTCHELKTKHVRDNARI
jgi:hypothetical protein